MQTNFVQDEIYTIKLTSGEELVTKVIGINADWLTVTSPVSVAPGPQGMGLVPAMFTCDPKSQVQININNITLYAATEGGVRSRYVEATTGIRVAEKKLVLG